jgi:hypothetical protein
MRAKFDQWLEDELGRTLTPIVSQPARPGQARYQVTRSHRLSIGRKAVVSLAMATMALGASAVLAAASGSLDPQVWGQQVSSAVEQCKTDLQPGLHGIGACVSAFARHQGQQMQTQPRGQRQPDALASRLLRRMSQQQLALVKSLCS